MEQILFLKGLGGYPDVNEKTNFYSVLEGYFKDCKYPVLYDCPVGHSDDTHTVPLGVEGEIDSKSFPGLIIKERCVG